MMKQFVYFFVSLSTLFTGCDYLDMVPEKDIETVETVFEKREQADLWLKGCYAMISNDVCSVIAAPGYTGADELVAGEYTRKTMEAGSILQWHGLFIGDGLQMTQQPYGNVWNNNQFYAAIRYCNIFLEKANGIYNMEEAEKELWIAEIKSVKAHYYFELMRRYGPIVLVPENIPVNVPIDVMQQPRAPIDSCVKAIVTLLDDAMKVLPPFRLKQQDRWGYFNLEAAAALKAQVLLYVASPLFNGNPMYANFRNKKGELLFSPTYDRERWKRAAIATEEAIEICLANGKELIKGNQSKNTKLRNVMTDLENAVLAANFKNNEAVFMLRPQGVEPNTWYKWVLPYYKSSDWDYASDCLGCIAPSMKMVEMYYTEHGLPIDADKGWGYSTRHQMSKETSPEYEDVVPLNMDVLGLHLRREPRFYANIAADRSYWIRGKSADRRLVTAYRGETFGTQATIIHNSVPQNLTGYWMKKSTYSEYTNREYGVVKGREEAAILIRLAELYLMKAEAWNEYEGPLADRSHVYDPLNEVRERAGIPDVESSWINYSKTPEKVKSKEGMREIIHREWNIELAFEGKRFWNLRRWLTAEQDLNEKLYGWNILGKDAQQFYNNFTGPVVVWGKRSFIAPRDYFFPIRSEEILISGCVQNPGW